MNGGEKGVTALLAVLRTAPAAAACAACLDELDAYVAAQLDGADVQTQFPRTAAHLDGCVACAEAYALVYEMMWQEAAGLLPAAAAPPDPDLRFLRQATKPRLAVLAAAVTRAPAAASCCATLPPRSRTAPRKPARPC